MVTLCCRKKSRTSRVHHIQRPCLDFEKMQQVNFYFKSICLNISNCCTVKFSSVRVKYVSLVEADGPMASSWKSTLVKYVLGILPILIWDSERQKYFISNFKLLFCSFGPGPWVGDTEGNCHYFAGEELGGSDHCKALTN